MGAKKRYNVEELSWSSIREDVVNTNSALAKIIDQINPTKELSFLKISYPYGSEIFKNGSFYLPNSSGQLVPIEHQTIHPHIKNLLTYPSASIPVCLILKNSIELSMALKDRIISFCGLITSGELFGEQQIFSSEESGKLPLFLWNITAGARSIFMLPKISEKEKHNKLKKTLRLKQNKPKNYLDHWEIFRSIANNSDFQHPWTTEILFFPKNWFDHLHDPAWSDFYHYILKSLWKKAEFSYNQLLWNTIFSIIQNDKDIKPNLYTANTVKHLLAIGAGAFPGFAPTTDNTAAPTHGIQEAYRNIYNLQHYPPIIMQPKRFSIDNPSSQPVYYSLPFPSTNEFGSKSRKRSIFITELHEIKSLLNKYVSVLSSGELDIGKTTLNDIVRKVKYDYYHNNVDLYYEMKESKEIPLEDPSFLSTNNKDFPETSSFFKGCIRISKKKLDL